ncbi:MULTISPECIES: serine hydrolase [unclassified Acidovorax]|jgi:D-alanyl-D-alanine endopeptidase (penicillin-binding protein 7)|uniref:serine hydrolase n=1 Tax=unclassified Acidovorax TaxID=2684926 RepID=UPI000B3F9C9D|nr:MULTISPECIES: serine hydrolase [unclassified Acidovorax]MBP3982210.1 serine hydrolase [Acidovorax sp. JG5]MBU4422924.1 serine hydrolase [Gammaproteobacteria bacterium]
MHHRRPTALNRFFQTIGLFVVSVALLSPAAQASERKKASVKKQQAQSVSAKRAAVTRKSAGAGRALRATARTAKAPTRVAFEPAKQSFGQMAGLHQVTDPLDLKSSVAFVIDQDTHEVLVSKNDHAVLPIASLTKLMTGLIITQARLPMDEPLTITQDDVDTEKGSRSRLSVGTTLTRGELLHLALMSSENRAAHALGRTYPGGLNAFVALMNSKARSIGMTDTIYVEPTGLSSRNQSSARDLARLVNVAHGDPVMREFSTSPGYEVAVGQKTLQYNNTNGLVKNPEWNIGLQKTGYISEAGRCLVMQTHIAGRKLIMVFLDSAGKFSRLGDAQRVRQWVESLPALGPKLQGARAG